MVQPTICPKFEKAISILSQRWTGLVIYQLLTGKQRFNEIQSAIGISGKVLSDRLKDLEQKGLVKRDVIPDTPVVQASATSPCITVAKTTLIRTDVCAWPSVGTTVPVVPDMAESIIRSQLSIAVATLSASAGR